MICEYDRCLGRKSSIWCFSYFWTVTNRYFSLCSFLYQALCLSEALFKSLGLLGCDITTNTKSPPCYVNLHPLVHLRVHTWPTNEPFLGIISLCMLGYSKHTHYIMLEISFSIRIPCITVYLSHGLTYGKIQEICQFCHNINKPI